MKNRKLTTLVVAGSLLLPVAAFGQSGATSSSDQSQSSSQQARDSQKPESKEYKTSAEQRTLGQSEQDADISASATFAASSDIRRVELDQLENQLTAEQLIGKNVVDSNGEKIATVKDIGLHSVLPSGFEQASLEASEEASSDAGYGASAGSDAGSTMSRSGSSHAQSSSQLGSELSGASGELEVYLSVGGVFGMGDDIVAVPASKLSFDRANDQLKIDATSAEVTAIAQPDQDLEAEDIYTPAE